MTRKTTCCLLGAPIGTGAGTAGCDLGPAALREARISEGLRLCGWQVTDLGDAHPQPGPTAVHRNPAIRHLDETAAWIRGLTAAALTAGRRHALPVFLGGDHSLAAATVPAMALRAEEAGRPLFVLWLDAHPDLHTLETTASGNLHGIPAAYFLGLPGFDALPHPAAQVPPAQVCMMGLRSIDSAEEARLVQCGVRVHRMPELHRDGVEAALGRFLDIVAEARGHLHVSLDVDFLDPSIAPAVGTKVPDGASAEQARTIAALLGDSGLVTSLDLVELNPSLDVNGMSATLLAELAVGMLTERRAASETESKTGT